MKKIKFLVAMGAIVLAASCNGTNSNRPQITLESTVNEQIWPDSAKQDWKGLVYIHPVIEISIKAKS
ncbi:hypothetical protein COR50_13595 [Chitinophaga caeni]|uniref:Uncharacterized protein n=1 Tax=Chitinophaga caeni TaxID=2029983 RepID=A0A291QW78_9BACT|nr:hypothetical protein [Chitinophaga caeni]ATL48113.1 hypothetical protein COR50_13595 [Chitinophaga caeni]